MYYKLATWEPRSFTFKDGKRGYDTEAAARADAKAAGTYRISEVSDTGRRDLEPFEVLVGTGTAAVRKTYGREATRPMGGRPH